MPKNSKETKTRTTILRFALLFVLAIAGTWIYGLKSFVDSIPTSIADNSSKTDAIIILTGGNGRVQEGIKLLNEEKAPKLLISGVGAEANLATILILSGRLPDNIAQLTDNIELGYKAQDTKGNATEALNWVKENNYKTIRLVTANYHIERSMMEFKKHMPDIKIIPHPVFPKDLVLEKWWQSGAAKKVLISEYNKYIVSKAGSLL